MSGEHSAAVFNQGEAAFAFAAEAIDYTQSPVTRMSHLMSSEAPGLRQYIATYVQEIAEPFNDTLAKKELVPEDRSGGTMFFTAGALMTFKMVDGVYRNTGATLPFLGTDLPQVPASEDVRFNHDEETPIIDLFYRGAEFRRRLPHVYRPALKLIKLMGAFTDYSAEALDADLSSTLAKHESADRAFKELHFIGGAAETALVIEEQATRK